MQSVKYSLLEYKGNNIVKFRIVQVYSPITFEKMNVGILIEEEDGFEIKLIENLNLYENMFPMFKLSEIEKSLKYLKLRSLRKKITSKEFKLTSILVLSDIKIYQKEKNENIYEELMKRYITLYKTGKFLRYIHKFIWNFSQDKRKSKYINSNDNIIEIKIISTKNIKPILNYIKLNKAKK